MVGFLVRHPERLVTYRQLVTAVWGPTYDPDQNLLRVHMGHIRRKLEPDPPRPKYFITDSGMGYRYQGQRGRMLGRPRRVRPARRHSCLLLK